MPSKAVWATGGGRTGKEMTGRKQGIRNKGTAADWPILSGHSAQLVKKVKKKLSGSDFLS